MFAETWLAGKAEAGDRASCVPSAARCIQVAAHATTLLLYREGSTALSGFAKCPICLPAPTEEAYPHEACIRRGSK